MSAISYPIERFSGKISLPGDKSISHRALIISASSIGESKIEGLLEGDDVIATANALRLLGAEIKKFDSGIWSVHGCGVGGFCEPENALDLGNSGTGARLLMGLMAATPIRTIFIGDKSLSSRPMRRVIEPLERMGGRFSSRSGDLLPITVYGRDSLLPANEKMLVPSAQVKSAILLAALNIQGKSTIIENIPTRDHTENMLKAFGTDIQVDGPKITVTGHPELLAQDMSIPGDISSAAFPLVASIICPDSNVKFLGVSLNPLRTGLLKTLREMGANIKEENVRTIAGERVGDVIVGTARLEGVDVSPSRSPSMIDEYPILAIAAAFAKGKTAFKGVSELRVKESDRLTSIARGLLACGVQVQETEDELIIIGQNGRPNGGGKIAVNLDHRIAMAFLVFGMAAKEPVVVDDVGVIGTSFPQFIDVMNSSGANIQVVK